MSVNVKRLGYILGYVSHQRYNITVLYRCLPTLLREILTAV